MELAEIPGTYSIIRYPADEKIPAWALELQGFWSITRTEEELSVLCATEVIQGEPSHREDNWKCLKVSGPLDFSLTGVLSSLAAPLAAAGISIFVLSTYDTDYLLVKADQLAHAKAVLRTARMRVV